MYRYCPVQRISTYGAEVQILTVTVLVLRTVVQTMVQTHYQVAGTKESNALPRGEGITLQPKITVLDEMKE
jgi:hypothetical protein